MNILIIEDEIGIVNFLKQGLEEEGFTITTAKNGQAGLEKATHQLFDLILIM